MPEKTIEMKVALLNEVDVKKLIDQMEMIEEYLGAIRSRLEASAVVFQPVKAFTPVRWAWAKTKDSLVNQVFIDELPATPPKYVIRRGSCVMMYDGDFIMEPLPSGRSEEFCERTRFGSLDEAIATATLYL